MYHIYTHCTIFLPIFTLTKKGKNAAKIYAANNVNDKGNKWKKNEKKIIIITKKNETNT